MTQCAQLARLTVCCRERDREIIPWYKTACIRCYHLLESTGKSVFCYSLIFKSGEHFKICMEIAKEENSVLCKIYFFSSYGNKLNCSQELVERRSNWPEPSVRLHGNLNYCKSSLNRRKCSVTAFKF